MPKAKKQKNGRWRCQISVGDEYVDGKRKQHVMSFTADTKAEAEDMASEYRRKHGRVPADASMTLSDAISRYIDSKSKVLSPTTIRGYKKDAEHVLEPLGNVPIRRLDQQTVQRWINSQTDDYSPKSIKNGYGLLTAAARAVDPTFRITVTMPKSKPKDFYIPSLDEVNRMIGATDNENLRKAIMLAAFGSLRRGEICALTHADIDKAGWISIDKDMIRDENGNYFVKQIPKTLESCRRTPVPSFVIDEMKTGLVTCTPHAITVAFERLIENEKMPHIRFHDLRHFFASHLHLKGIPDAYIEKYGGWKPGSDVMKKIYRNTIRAEEEQQAAKIVEVFSQKRA